MDSEELLAVTAERSFNSLNTLLITFHEQEVNKNAMKHLHSDIKDVEMLQPTYIPKKRCIIEVKERSNLNAVKDVLTKQHFGNQYVTVDPVKYFENSYENIDPYKLQIRNLPFSASDRDIKLLFPLCMWHKFLHSESKRTKTAIVHFATVEEAVLGFRTTNLITYQSNTLSVQFYRRSSNHLLCDEMFDTTQESESENDDDDIILDDEVYSSKLDSEDSHLQEDSESEDDVSRWKQVEDESLKNKKISDTLYIQNFPINTTDEEILKLFPNCLEFKFMPSKQKSAKSVLIRFQNTDDAILAYTVSNNIYKSHVLQIEFFLENFEAVLNLKESKNKLLNNGVFRNQDRQDEALNEERSTQTNSNVDSRGNISSNISVKIEANEKIDPCILHVQNLPLSTTTEDLLELYPKNQEYQILPEKTENSASAFVCFSSAEDALEAYNATRNKTYQSRVLSVNFKCRNLIINPLALRKHKTKPAEELKTVVKKTKFASCRKNFENDDLIIVGETQIGHMRQLTEDDIDYKSEDEDYIDDVYACPELENEDLEEDLSEDNEFQGIELDDDSFLPLDEDDELNE